MEAMEKFKLTGRVAVVTGGSMGLGRAMAVGLAGAGARVAVVSRTKKLIAETAAEIVRKGGDAIAVAADVTREDDIEGMVAEVCGKAGVSEATYYNWRKTYGRPIPSEKKRLRQLESLPSG